MHEVGQEVLAYLLALPKDEDRLGASHSSECHLCLCMMLLAGTVHLTGNHERILLRLVCAPCLTGISECEIRVTARPGAEPPVYDTCCKQPQGRTAAC